VDLGEPVVSSQGENDYLPFKVTGEGVYEHFYYEDPVAGVEWYASDEEVGLFSISIDPDGKSPQAVIRVDGVKLREVWGGPLLIQDDWVACLPQDPYRPEDVKPGQLFMFYTHHAVLGDVQIGVFAHDNCTPGYNTSEDPVWSDWFALVIEPLGGDVTPGTADDLFTGMGIVTSGNIMDHRLHVNDYVPFKVTGEGVYEHFYYEDPVAGVEWYASDEEVGLFSISIDPDGKSPRAVIRVEGVKLREVWGGPLLIQDDWAACLPQDPYRPEDVKPGQTFIFYTQHPVLGEVQVAVYVHDNVTPGYYAEDATWSDWFALIIEPLGGDGVPGNEDDLFTSMGIVTSGNIMDHRQ
jgi:FtsP/CotA-like multicopper oxidase with cupredoxin domain